MELVFSSALLTLLLLVGSFVDFLMARSMPRSLAHGDAFFGEPKPMPLVDSQTDYAVEYDRAA